MSRTSPIGTRRVQVAVTFTEQTGENYYQTEDIGKIEIGVTIGENPLFDGDRFTVLLADMIGGLYRAARPGVVQPEPDQVDPLHLVESSEPI